MGVLFRGSARSGDIAWLVRSNLCRIAVLQGFARSVLCVPLHLRFTRGLVPKHLFRERSDFDFLLSPRLSRFARPVCPKLACFEETAPTANGA